jgi:hypothetical protein
MIRRPRGRVMHRNRPLPCRYGARCEARRLCNLSAEQERAVLKAVPHNDKEAQREGDVKVYV